MTVDSLAADLTRLGVEPGMTLLVHSSLKSLGWVSGGEPAVVLALEKALGRDGTLVMPSHSSDLTDPAEWCNPPVPRDWWKTIRESMPPFDPDLTPTCAMGAIAECFRKQHGVVRSNHPNVSFAARGPHAEKITANHSLDNGLGNSSPLARIYDLNGYVLLLGVGHERNTSLHLAEYRAPSHCRISVKHGAPIIRNGLREWIEYRDIDLDRSDFDAIGAAFEKESGSVRIGSVGLATARLMRQRELVDVGAEWMGRMR